jgi:hypothetical protein
MIDTNARASAIVPAGGSVMPVCPACGQRGLVRIRRRAVDQFFNIFIKQRRFRCPHFQCQWQGNLNSSGTPPMQAILKHAEIIKRIPKSMYMPALISGIAAIVFGAAMAVTGLPTFGQATSSPDSSREAPAQARLAETAAVQPAAAATNQPNAESRRSTLLLDGRKQSGR